MVLRCIQVQRLDEYLPSASNLMFWRTSEELFLRETGEGKQREEEGSSFESKQAAPIYLDLY